MDPQEFMGAFLEELDEQLVLLEQKILALEEQGDDQETVSDLFRVAHTLKGSSAAMGFEAIKDVTHAMEQILDEVRHHRLPVTPDMVQVLFRCFDGLQGLREHIEDEDSIEVVPLLEELRAFLNSESPRPLSVSIATEDTIVLSLDAEVKMSQSVQTGLHVYDVYLEFNSDSAMRGVRAYLAVQTLDEMGDILQVFPSIEEMEVREDSAVPSFRVILATHWDAEPIRLAVTRSEYRRVQVSPFEPKPARKGEESAVATRDASKSIRKSTSVRVEVDQLETLMNLVGELVINQARIDQVNRNLTQKFKGEEDVTTLGDISRHVSRIVGQLQESIMAARMLPIESLFDRFPRIVRDLAHALDKDIHLLIEGKETRLDRTVIEEIADPLIHLVRNAVDHGIESRDKRNGAGKSPEGTVRLTASHEDNKILITVEDDGAGMDAEQIRKTAIDKGVITELEAQTMGEAESLQLIFRPGFSTRQKVSDVSGRGVGMDIVRDHIERLNGTIDIETRLGRGSQFKIKLPLTLAILPGLLVGVSDSTFIVPTSNVFEIVRIVPEAIQSIHGRPTILLRGQSTPLVYLRDYFGLSSRPSMKKYVPVVVAGVAQKRVALVVDDLYGNHEFVKKALNDRVGTPDGISGVTILGNGQVGLILDIAALQRGLDQRRRG